MTFGQNQNSNYRHACPPTRDMTPWPLHHRKFSRVCVPLAGPQQPTQMPRSTRSKSTVVPQAEQLAPGAVVVNKTAAEATAEAAKAANDAIEAGEVLTMSASTEIIKQ
eukprot:4162568-Prymnesium_polylepis.1